MNALAAVGLALAFGAGSFVIITLILTITDHYRNRSTK